MKLEAFWGGAVVHFAIMAISRNELSLITARCSWQNERP